MQGNENLITELIGKSSSELMLFFILFVVAFVPIYTILLKGRTAKDKREDVRDKQLIDIVTKNTEALTEMADAVKACKDHRALLCQIQNIVQRAAEIPDSDKVSCDEGGGG
jgi:hypothetical protein